MRLITAWAIVATVIAVGALGYIAGKNSQSPPEPERYTLGDASDAATEPGSAPQSQQAAYVIPKSFTNLPAQWRTVVGQFANGYAVLFDPEQRELIVEQCEHPGYQVDASGEPIPLTKDMCAPVLWSTIAALEEAKSTLINRDGSRTTLAMALDDTGEDVVLRLKFGQHDVTLIPGSKNDLVVAMEKTPDISRQKQAYQAAMMADRPSPLRK